MKLIKNQLLVPIHFWIFALLSVWAAPRGIAQNAPSQEEIRIDAKAIYQNGKIYLRWEPINPLTWQMGNERGYVIKRYPITLDARGQEVTDTIPTEFMVKTLGDAQLLALNEVPLAYAAKAIYRPQELITPSPTPVDEFTKAFQQEELKNAAREAALLIASSNFVHATKIGLGLLNDNLKPGEIKYKYVILINDMDSVEQLAFRPGIVAVANSAGTGIEKLANLRAETDDKYVMLKWNKPPADDFLYYDVYRKEYPSGTFAKVNQYPYSFSDKSDNPDVLYADSLPNNTSRYQYYVVGMTNFGLLSPPSDYIIAKGKPKPVGAIPFIESITESNPGKQLITWSFSGTLINRLQGFQIKRAKDREDAFVTIATVGPRVPAQVTPEPVIQSYLDLFPLTTAYYMIVALDENANELPSIPKLAQLEDNVPPAKPINLSGTVDLEGFAQVQWKANTEADLLGYHVFFSNNENGDYIPMTEEPVSLAEFSKYVNIETLANEIWVKVKALDFHDNNSPFSDAYRLKLPDVTPPSCPVLVKVENRDKCIYIKWNASSSEDVVRHEVQRRPLHFEGDWEIIATYLPVLRVDTSHCDTTMACWIEYEYRIKAIDDVDLCCYSGKGTGMLASSYCYRAVNAPRAFYSNAVLNPQNTSAFRTPKGFICLYWEFPCDYPVQEFHIYKRLGPGQPLVLVRSITPKKAIFTSYFTVPDPNNPDKTITCGFPIPTAKPPITPLPPTGEPGLTTSPNGNTPLTIVKKKTKTISTDLCAYLIEDDDIAILDTVHNSGVEYVIQVEFKDGTRSSFSEKIKP
jgi:uncharacterized protein